MESRILTCVYCGHEYPQDTPAHGEKVLTDHIAGCEKHPMRAVVEQRDKLRDERDTHARWRQDMADLLGECERVRDALGVALNKAMAIGEMLAAVVQGAKEEFVRVPYGASHEDVAAINDWHKMAAEALAKWENKA